MKKLLPLLFLSLILYWSCENPLESRVEALENQLAEQETEQEQQQALIDSLMAEILNQQTVMDSLDASQQAYIDSLINLGNVSDSLLQVYTDSLNTVQNAYIDSLHNAQQTTLEALANSALSAGFVETEVFSGLLSSSWTDLDLSNAIGQAESLVLLRANHISGNSAYLVLRPNGSSLEYNEGNSFSGDRGVSGVYLSNDTGKTGYIFMYSDADGIIEQKNIDPDTEPNISISVVFYLN